ncbi:MAG TPA: hypothetical protein V6D22_11765 [Candidatus Obscuribacterales bacterium]
MFGTFGHLLVRVGPNQVSGAQSITHLEMRDNKRLATRWLGVFEVEIALYPAIFDNAT